MILYFNELSFKNNRLKHEFFYELDQRLLFVVNAVIEFQKFVIGLTDPVLFQVTHITRTWAKQDELYGAKKDYRRDPWPSVHMFSPSCAVDGLTAIKTETQRQALVVYVERKILYPGRYSSVVMHDAGSGMHAHCQVKPTEGNKLVEGESRYATTPSEVTA